jgi:hypothetical protein
MERCGAIVNTLTPRPQRKDRPKGAVSLFVRPAWASTWRWKSSRELVTASEAHRRASDREAGVKEAGSEAAGRRTGTGCEAELSRASGQTTVKLW